MKRNPTDLAMWRGMGRIAIAAETSRARHRQSVDLHEVLNAIR